MIIKIVIVFLVVVAIYDLFQTKHTVWRNFPILGHLRFIFELIGPEIRQYWFESNTEKKPFNRTERSWIYASSKNENNKTGFGSEADMTQNEYVFFLSGVVQKKYHTPNPKCAKIIGEGKRERPFRPSLVNISGMSYGALGDVAVTAHNKGALLAGCFHNTGEGGFSEYHNFGADVCFQIGTAYYGCRDEQGNFSLEKLVALIKKYPVIKLIEIKLSQGAKAGEGGNLPAAKNTPKIAKVRGIKPWTDSISPAYHSQFSNVEELVSFIELVAEATGLPVGIKSAVGALEQWYELAEIMQTTSKGPDFITIDGGEGGTGSAEYTSADHVALPFFEAFSLVYQIFQKYSITNKVVFIGSGKLGLGDRAIQAFAMGVDVINTARGTLLSNGCLQAQACHRGKCPSGQATHKWWLKLGFFPVKKSKRFANYHKALLKTIFTLTHTCGCDHPSQLAMNNVKINYLEKKVLLELYYGYKKTKVTPTAVAVA